MDTGHRQATQEPLPSYAVVDRSSTQSGDPEGLSLGVRIICRTFFGDFRGIVNLEHRRRTMLQVDDLVLASASLGKTCPSTDSSREWLPSPGQGSSAGPVPSPWTIPASRYLTHSGETAMPMLDTGQA